MAMFVPTAEANAMPMQQFAAPEMKNFAPEQAAKAGALLEKQGDLISQIATEYRNNVATAKVKDADNRLADITNDLLLNPETGFMAQSGKNAVDNHKDVLKRFDDAVSKASEGMTDDIEKVMFKKAAAARSDSFRKQVLGHTLHQTKVWRLQATEARVATATQELINAATDNGSSAYKQAHEKIKAETADSASLAGLDPDAAKLLMATNLTKAHTEAVNSMISMNNPEMAQSYLDQAIKNKEVLPSEVDRIRKGLDVALDKKLGSAAGDEIFAAEMEKVNNDINKAIPESEMLAAIKKSGLSDRAQEIATAKVIGNINRMRAQRRQYEEEASNQVHKMMTKDSNMSEYSQVVGYISGLDNVDATAKGNLKEHAMRFYGIREKQAEARSEAKIQKHINGLINLRNTVDDYIGGKYGKLSYQDALAKFAPMLGANTDDFARLVDKVNTKLENPSVKYAEFNRALQVMAANKDFKKTLGFDPASKDASVTQKKLLLFESTLDNMSAFGSKGPTNQISMDKAISLALKDVTIQNKMLGFIPSSDTYQSYMIPTLPEETQRKIVEKQLDLAVQPKTPANITKGMELLRKKRNTTTYALDEE